MKRVLIALFFCILLVGLVSAASNQSSNAQNKTQEKNQTQNKTNQGIGQELSQEIRERKAEFRQGNFTGPQGQFLQVSEIVAGLKELRVGSVKVNTSLNITKETDNNKTKIKTKLSNGQEREIKIMPDSASERAIERLKLKVCSEENNCTIILKEVGKNNNKTAAYEIRVQRHYKLLALFKLKAENKAEVDAETGEVTITKKPWWAFLAREQD